MSVFSSENGFEITVENYPWVVSGPEDPIVVQVRLVLKPSITASPPTGKNILLHIRIQE